MIVRAGRPRVPAPVAVAIVAAWTCVLVAEITGDAGLLHAHAHGQQHDLPFWLVVLLPTFWLTVAVFLVAWQVMIAAMMLPASLPLIRLFSAAASRQEHPRLARAAFLGGYAVVWAAFGAAAFVADVAVRGAVEGTPWLREHATLVPALALALAGAFQFSELKDRCLDECRHPAPFLMRYYRRGVGEAYGLGKRHGIFCLGCCWALMLVMVVLGVASLALMALLAVVMYYERAGRYGRRIAPVVGIVLLAAAAVVAAAPDVVPAGLLGSW